jgi:hypothetical protein
MASSHTSFDGASGRVATGSYAAACLDDDEQEESYARPTKSVRSIKFCNEWRLPRDLMCSGCILYEDASPASKAKGPREITHRHDKYQCRKPWLEGPSKPKSYDLGGCNSKALKIRQFIIEEHGEDAGRLLGRIITTTPASVVHVTTKGAIEMLMNELSPSSLSSSNNGSESQLSSEESNGRKVPKQLDDVELWTETISSMGHEFVVTGIPVTHCLIAKNHYAKLRNAEKVVKELQSLHQHGRFAGGSSLMQAMTSIATTSCAALPLSQAANVIPMVVAATLIDLGILNKSKVSAFATSFPSETYLREMLFSFAAQVIFVLRNKLSNIRQVFLACDKGNKKGISHFVKILSWYDTKTKSVMKQLLDIDASESTTNECADAIVASLKKVGSIRLQGQCTDSGGGGVLDGLHQAIAHRQLCRPGYLVTSCSLHNLQLSVANPIKQTMGEGALGVKNVMQLVLHSIYDLQECLDNDVWKLHVDEAVKFLEAYSTTAYVGALEPDELFAKKWELVKTFRHFDATLTKKNWTVQAFRYQSQS